MTGLDDEMPVETREGVERGLREAERVLVECYGLPIGGRALSLELARRHRTGEIDDEPAVTRYWSFRAAADDWGIE